MGVLSRSCHAPHARRRLPCPPELRSAGMLSALRLCACAADSASPALFLSFVSTKARPRPDSSGSLSSLSLLSCTSCASARVARRTGCGASALVLLHQRRADDEHKEHASGLLLCSL
ncbi:hypothetical protein FA09DRAFT_88359 [Tilletiopsis washingtonensis]|uniref:Uncharacterized protein n=1 Tax=Tilletiopsis washingtonensis TaxID=58919 RepID=A0A316Z627_9BASI|nr:hypothetical protein FA09DRAFT_88359 [Tilletiopsis washingtonensis]PWN96412.1 hypothetical protein FA09DRAFT_88359 [Tilletiopsis washingtonensis]